MRFTPVLTMLALLCCASGPAFAQTAAAPGQPHVVDRAAIDRTLTQAVQAQDAQRATIRHVLHQPEAQRIAERLGLRVTDMDAAGAGLDGHDLSLAATQAQQADDALAGGDVVVISVTTLLLVLILVVLIAK
jgi:hypothetical protein